MTAGNANLLSFLSWEEKDKKILRLSVCRHVRQRPSISQRRILGFEAPTPSGVWVEILVPAPCPGLLILILGEFLSLKRLLSTTTLRTTNLQVLSLNPGNYYTCKT